MKNYKENQESAYKELSATRNRMSNRRIYLEMLLEKYSKIEPLEKYNKTFWTLRGREFNRYKKDHFMQLTQYDVYKSDLKSSIQEENKNVTPSKWRTELNNIDQEYERVTKQLSDTTVNLAVIEVLEHNNKELNRMLENESQM